jgi:hypothetical protein
MNLIWYIVTMILCFLTAHNSVLWQERAKTNPLCYPYPEDSFFAVWFFHREIGLLWFVLELALFAAGFFYLPAWAPVVGAAASPFSAYFLLRIDLVGSGFIPLFGLLAIIACSLCFATPPYETF